MGRLVYPPSASQVRTPMPSSRTCSPDGGTLSWRRTSLLIRSVAECRRCCGWPTSWVPTPWQWSAADADDFFGHLRGVGNLAHTTVRAYQTDVKVFLDYATDPAYDWNEHCGRLFGTVFSQVVTEFNRARHVQANDARPLKRPFTPTELQQFFDLADLEPERILIAGRKGALAAWRDAVAFKTLYGWGLRRNEVRHLQLVDVSRNVRAPFFGEWGLVRVRHGKAMRGAPAKQRTVLTVFDWAAEAVADWAARGLPRYGEPLNDLFPTEKGGLVPERNLWQRMRDLVDELGFPAGLDLHSFRRSYATNLQTEYGYDVSFVQLQLGHEHASTTSIYTVAAPDYRARELARVLNATLARSNPDLGAPTREES